MHDAGDTVRTGIGEEDNVAEALATRPMGFTTRASPAPNGTTTILAQRLASEYREMPGLSLTVAQAARLLGVDRLVSGAALRELEACGTLRRTPEGHYRVAGDLQCAWRRVG
jgi:hypothetical protein